MTKIQKILSIIKILKNLLLEKNNEVRNIIIKYPELFFFKSSQFKNEILRGFYSNSPFNGQIIRKQLVTDTINQFKPDLLIETGTYLGNTLEFLLEFNIPTHSVEVNESFYLIAKSRFLNNENLNLIHGDSGEYLKTLDFNENSVFAYLDAHWYENLPLDNELKTLSSFKNIIILIDDFMVPNNSSWKHDSYGSTNLNLESVDIPESFSIFFPSYRPREDAGMGTGCVWLAKGELSINVLSRFEKLYLFNK